MERNEPQVRSLARARAPRPQERLVGRCLPRRPQSPPPSAPPPARPPQKRSQRYQCRRRYQCERPAKDPGAYPPSHVLFDPCASFPAGGPRQSSHHCFPAGANPLTDSLTHPLPSTSLTHTFPRPSKHPACAPRMTSPSRRRARHAVDLYGDKCVGEGEGEIHQRARHSARTLASWGRGKTRLFPLRSLSLSKEFLFDRESDGGLATSTSISCCVPCTPRLILKVLAAVGLKVRVVRADGTLEGAVDAVIHVRIGLAVV